MVGTVDLCSVLVFEPVGFEIDTFTANDYEGEVTDDNPLLKTLSMAGEANLPILGVVNFSSNTSFTPTAENMTVISNQGRNKSCYVIYGENDTPLDSDYDMDDAGFGNALAGAYYDFTSV
jgi:hypothetical protein